MTLLRSKNNFLIIAIKIMVKNKKGAKLRYITIYINRNFAPFLFLSIRLSM